MSAGTKIRAWPVAMAFVLAVLAACSDTTAPNGPIPVASVAVTPAASSLTVGEAVTLTASPRAEDGQPLDRAVSWSSENESLATVSSAGVVTTLAVGEVGIRATSEGVIGRALLTIAAVPPVPVAEVRLSVDAEVELAWNGTTTITAVPLDADGNELEARPVQWLTNRPNIVTVNKGALQAIQPGVATVSAIIDGVVSSVGVRVLDAPITSLAIQGPTGLEVGEVAGFASKITRANGEVMYGPVSWTSSAPGVIAVDDEDLFGATLSAIATGVATITIAREGVLASITLRVTPRVTHDLIYNRSTRAGVEIFVMGLAQDGSIPVRLNAGNVSREPSPSPDGSQFVFAVSQQAPTGEMQHDLYIVNRNGLNMRWLTRLPGIEDQPAWSPDGTRILFHGIANGKPDLYVINVDGTGLANLTAGLRQDMTDKRHPAWSPDGSRIAFIGVIGSQHKVWTVGSDGAGAVQVTTDTGFDESPTFSPDGARIAFIRYNAATPALGDDIMIVAALGGAPTRLALPGDQWNPVWSPDGHYIAVNGSAIADQGQNEVYTVRPDGTGLKLRTVNPAWGGGVNPAWIVR